MINVGPGKRMGPVPLGPDVNGHQVMLEGPRPAPSIRELAHVNSETSASSVMTNLS